MDKPVIIIEAPELNDEGVANVRAFLQEIIFSFESHYRRRLLKYHCRFAELDEFNKKTNDNK
jgi:hypothetical protein